MIHLPVGLKLYIASKTKASFQGSRDLRKRAAGTLGISTGQIPESRYTDLDGFFVARNEIAHRLDLLPDRVGWDAGPRRKHRNQDEVLEMCDAALLLVRDLIRATAENLSRCR